MQLLDEIKNRWLRIFEIGVLHLRCKKLKETISVIQTISDVQFLLDRVVELERDLGDALNPYSSRMGKLVLVKDGETHYRINGKYVKISSLFEALKLLGELQKQELIKNGMIKVSKEIIARLKEFSDENEKEENDKPV